MYAEITAAQKKLIFYILFFIALLMGMGIDSLTPSLPAIDLYFNVPSNITELTVGLYMLGYALGQIILGVLSDSFGRRKVVLIMGAMYVILCLMAALSPNIYILIFCRFLQGFAIAGPAVVTRAIATDCFSGLELSKAISFISTSLALGLALGPLIGPVVGSYLKQYISWQANFYFLALYAFGIFSYAAVTLEETHLDRAPFHLPYLLGMLKKTSTHPLFLIYSILGAIFYSGLVVFNVISPFLIQVDLHYSIIEYGNISLILGLGFFGGNLLNQFLLRYIDPIRIIEIGINGSVLTAFLMIALSFIAPFNLPVVVIPAFILFFLSGMTFPNLMGASVRIFPEMGGTSSAVFGFFISVGVFIFSSLATLLSTRSEIGMFGMYLGMFVLSFILFNISKRMNRG